MIEEFSKDNGKVDENVTPKYNLALSHDGIQTQITMMLCTIAGGQTKGANERSFVFVLLHGSDDSTRKPPIVENGFK